MILYVKILLIYYWTRSLIAPMGRCAGLKAACVAVKFRV